MGRVVRWLVLIIIYMSLTGCPLKDWIKRDDNYMTVEQYRMMTEVISINDSLYRVKKGEEINQNKITQLFFNLQQFINTPQKEKKQTFKALKKTYQSEKTTFNSVTYALILLEYKGREKEARAVLSQIGRSGIRPEDKNLVNLAHTLHNALKSGDSSKRKYRQLNREYELIKEEVGYLNKQINALKSIEESIHAREIRIE